MSDAFSELLDKYLEMRAMRLAHEAGEPADPARMRSLAARFPGALREIDELPLGVIDARIGALERGERPGWAVTLAAFHGWMRVALRVKRRFGRDADPEDVREWLEATHRPRHGEPSLDDLDLPAIERILRPPGGRLSRCVLERIALERELSLEEVVAEAFMPRNA